MKKPMIVKFKKLHKDAVIPSYSKSGDAGLDLVAVEKIENTSFQYVYRIGIAVEIPEGFVGLLFSRSSIRNKDLTLSNSVGVIDSGFRGNIEITFNKTNGLDSFGYKVGDKIAQLLVIPFPYVTLIEVDELSETERGENGHGSTDKKDNI